MATSLFQITRRSNEAISGVHNSHSYAGMGVQIDPSDMHTLVQADGTTGFHLTRDVLPAADVDVVLLNTFPGRQIVRPEIIGNVVSAHRALEAKIEGEDYLVLSGTGALDENTAAKAELGYYGGRLREIQSGDELAGIVRAQIAPEDTDNAFALLVEFVTP